MKPALFHILLACCLFIFLYTGCTNAGQPPAEKHATLSPAVDSILTDTAGNNKFIKRIKQRALLAANDTEQVAALDVVSERLPDKQAIKVTREALRIAAGAGYWWGQAEAGLRLALLTERREKNPKSADSLIAYYKKAAEERNSTRGLARTELTISEILSSRGQADSAFAHATTATDLALKTDDSYLKAMCYRAQANYYLMQQDREKEAAAYKEAVKYARLSGDTMVLSTSLNRLGNIYRLTQDRSNALTNLVETMNMYELIGDAQRLIIILIDIGELYRVEKKNAEAQKYYEKALPYLPRVKEPAPKIYFYGSIGVNLKDMKKYDESMNYISKGIDIAKESGNPVMLAGCYIFMGEMYYDKRDSLKGDEYLSLALEEGKKTNNYNVISASLYHLSLSSFTRGDFRKSIALSTEALEASITGQSMADQKEICLTLANAYDTLGQPGKAIKMLKTYMKLKDSLTNIESVKKFAEVEYQAKEAKLVAEQRAKEAEQKAIGEAESKKKNVIIFSVAGGLLLVLVFSILIFNRFRITQKQKEIIERQKVMVDEKNKEILDSITYARHLQQAILPSVAAIEKSFSDSFIFYKPKDIVAGDFYWMEVANNSSPGRPVLIAVADCTGHGVPGAMVSVVCSNALNRAVKEFHITEPGKILDKTRELVVETFEKSGDHVKDGMDISLCSVSYSADRSKARVSWAGANNALWFMRNGVMEEIRPDKQPIGKYADEKPFTTHEVELQKGDSIYLFTDGYADQFGGPNGKKFKYKQLKELIAQWSGLGMAEIRQKLDLQFEEWRGKVEQVDDVCVIGIRV